MPRHTGLEIDRTHAPIVRKVMNDNSGAAVVLINLLSRGRRIGAPVSDEAVWCLTMLDSFGIYGADLHVFWADVCGCNIELMLTVLRACNDECNGVNRDTVIQAIACCNQVSIPSELLLVP